MASPPSQRTGRADFSARQAMEACHIVASQHQLWTGGGAVLTQQAKAAIDAGAFHNDVVAVSNGPVLMFHGGAFEQRDALLEGLKTSLRRARF